MTAAEIRRELTYLDWVWRLLTPLERHRWRSFAATAGPEWALHSLFLESKENGEKSSNTEI